MNYVHIDLNAQRLTQLPHQIKSQESKLATLVAAGADPRLIAQQQGWVKASHDELATRLSRAN
jgi:hypothetical protein